MKHTLKITIFLIAFFILAQLFGLFLIAKDAEVKTEIINNQTVTTVYHNDTSMGPRPETSGLGSLIYIIIGVAIGTILVLILIKFQKTNIWRLWFFLAVWIALSISLGVLIKQKLFFDYGVAIIVAFVLALWKILKPNVFVHNITEVLMYAGIAVLIVPIFDVLWTIILLLIISAYDVYAVWKSKHMVKMAQFQTKSQIFAGLMIPYKVKEEIKETTIKKLKTTKSTTTSSKSNMNKTKEKEEPRTAILGGGDVAFPLIFSGAVLEGLIREGLTKSTAFMHASIITLTTAIALTLLFIYAKKGKFYPAMPFVTAGCLIGWVIVILI